ncbi:MAG: small multi-drug export protein [Acutalibacteraceae bacterium]|nr:small multi-drug export protein [Acutalibacteraceae bacterium]
MDSIISAMTEFFKSWLSPEVIIFLISLLPVLELRGGLIAAAILGVEWWIAFPICVIGNMLPIPFILLFIRKIFDFIKKTNFLWMGNLVTKLDERAQNKSKGVETASFWGLFALVAIPLPGTGGWTGALVANILNVKIGRASWIITLGVITAGLITSFISYVIPMLFV